MNDEIRSNDDLPTAAPNDTRGQNLAREAAKWRTQYRSAQAEIEQLKSQLAGAPVASQPAGEANPSSVPVSADEGDADLRQLRDELQGAVLLQSLAEAGAALVEDAADLLRARNQLVFDADGLPAVLVDGQAQPITFQSLSKVLHPQFLTSAGVAGSGSRLGHRGSVQGLDFARGLSDPAYFRANKQAMREEMKRRTR